MIDMLRFNVSLMVERSELILTHQNETLKW